MPQNQPVVTDEAKIFACIGYICLQWSLLEMNMLRVIYTIESISAPHGDIIYGGLDMRPRCNMAVNLARFHNLPPPIIKRISRVREKLKKDKIDDRRNQAVHGVHKASEKNEHVSLTMVRWNGDKKTQDVSIDDLFSLGQQIHGLSVEAWNIADAIGVWKFGSLPNHRQKNSVDEGAVGNSAPFLKFAHNFYARILHFFRKRDD